MSTDGSDTKHARNGCPYCGAALDVGFGDFLPTKGRGGPVRKTCASCRGQVRLATSSQIAGVAGLMLGLLGGAAVGAHFAASLSDQMTLIVLGGAAAGGFLLSFVMGYTFLRFDPDVAPPPRQVRERGKRKRGR
jgi:hypothetical protein